MVKIQTSYMELNWLAKKDKDIALPLILFDVYTGGSGGYYEPLKTEILINERFYPLDKGIICIGVSDDLSIANVIAHEYRHHWQFMNGWTMNSPGWVDDGKDYKQKIIEYFTGSTSETDALLYSNKMAKCDFSLEWYEWILKEQEYFKAGINRHRLCI